MTVPNSTCSVIDCDSVARARELCSKHYQRMKRSGTTEARTTQSYCSFPGCTEKHHAKTLCKGHWEQARHGRSLNDLSRSRLSPAEKAARKVEQRGDCLVWKGNLNENGYGYLWTGKRNYPAHRFFYEMENGPISDGLVIDHICFNHACVKVEHLRAVTQKQNQEHLRGANTNSQTGVRGVTYHKKFQLFHARVKHNGKRYSGGYFKTIEEADAAVRELRAKLFTHDDAIY